MVSLEKVTLKSCNILEKSGSVMYYGYKICSIKQDFLAHNKFCIRKGVLNKISILSKSKHASFVCFYLV